MLGKKHREALRRQSKRRAPRPEPPIVGPTQLKASGTLENRLTRDHQDVLQNVEFALVSAYRKADEVDDKTVEAVLRSAIRGVQSDDPIVQWVQTLLDAMRATRKDVSDDLWIDALRVVYASVRRHSACRAGDIHYLDFVTQFVV